MSNPSYDGIEELDHVLPRWWLFTLYAAMVFAVGYWGWYQVFGIGASTQEEYAAAVAEHAAMQAAHEAKQPRPTEDVLVALARDDAAVGRGRLVYQQNCVACHGPELRGLVGPNLVDATWLHGDKATQILGVVEDGVLAKGMPAWKPVLGPAKSAEVTAFILAMRGKAPSGT